MKNAAVHLVRTRFGDDVDDAARRATELRIRSTGHDLELLHRLQRDVDGRALAAHLLAEEAVVVVAAVEADVVEYAALSGDCLLYTSDAADE